MADGFQRTVLTQKNINIFQKTFNFKIKKFVIKKNKILKLKEILMNWGLSEQLAAPLKNTVVILGLIIITFLAYFITKKISKSA